MKNTSRRKLAPGTNQGRQIKETDPPPPPDQDLILFQELHKREKDRNIVTLLQPVSEEFEPNGNHQLYRIASTKKGSGFEFLAEREKNDYDWLKTPPATPLFPSLEMDANSPKFIIQREIPIIQPLSRFAVVTNSKPEAADKQSFGRPKFGNLKSKLPLRSVTPRTQRQSTVLSSSTNQTKIIKDVAVIRTDVPVLNKQTARKSATDHNDMIITRKTKPTTTSRSPVMYPQIPLVRSTNNIPAGFSNEKSPNLRTERHLVSAAPDRSALGKSTASPVRTRPRMTVAELGRPQSCSSIASISKGRKVASSSVEGNMQLGFKHCHVKEGDLFHTNTPKGIISNKHGNRGQVLGSKMVQRFMSARSKVVNLEEKGKNRFSLNDTSEFGRRIPKNSTDAV
ncbi:uncharacterized protein LOC126799935 [Argentina anserina]|uniref:uncharacterized protein LOC126799935 n=1 Tax=Argentina anserina TaxID=57926 RepID=UPI0021764D29|nr:uncharacterized protein LOC126799935 [Potentilla anserina]